MRPPGFAIIGTGRSGTRYMSAVLRAGRVDCGHEQWWTPLARGRRSGLDGDSSWLALPDIEAGTWSGPVVHVTRHPVDVVSSLVGIGFFDFEVRHGEFPRFALTHEPQLAGMAPLVAAVEWWARWNRRCAAVADLTVRVEDLPGRLGEVADVIGRDVDRAAAAGVSTTVNHRCRAPVDDTQVWRRLAGRAAPFGYSPEVNRAAELRGQGTPAPQ